MPAKKYIVKLNQAEREKLSILVKTGKAAAYKGQRAQILLKAEIGAEGPGLKDSDIVTSIDVYTAKHGSWLNMTEIEFSLLSRQCMSDRMADRAYLAQEVLAWVAHRNAIESEMNWRFTTEDA